MFYIGVLKRLNPLELDFCFIARFSCVGLIVQAKKSPFLSLFLELLFWWEGLFSWGLRFVRDDGNVLQGWEGSYGQW